MTQALFGFPDPADIWNNVVDFFTISPFWFYLFWGVVISFVAMFLGWAFPPLRSVAGAVVLAIAGGLFAYRRGETDTQKREAEKRARELDRERQSQNTGGDWFNWR